MVSTNTLISNIQTLTDNIPNTDISNVVVIDTENSRIGVKINDPQYAIHVDGSGETIKCPTLVVEDNIDCTSGNIICSSLDVTNTLNISGGSITGVTQINADLITADESTLNVTSITSDDRFKHNEKNINNGLNVIRKLNPQIYDKTKTFKKANYRGKINEPYIVEAGFIAQEVNKINELKFTVTEGSKTKPYALNYNNIFVYSVAAIIEIDKEISKIQNAINIIKEDLDIKYNNLLKRFDLITNKIQNIDNINKTVSTFNMKLNKYDANYNNKDKLVQENLINLQKIIQGQNNVIKKLTSRIEKLEK